MVCFNPKAKAQVEAAQRMLSPQWAANRITNEWLERKQASGWALPGISLSSPLKAETILKLQLPQWEIKSNDNLIVFAGGLVALYMDYRI